MFWSLEIGDVMFSLIWLLVAKQCPGVSLDLTSGKFILRLLCLSMKPESLGSRNQGFAAASWVHLSLLHTRAPALHMGARAGESALAPQHHLRRHPTFCPYPAILSVWHLSQAIQHYLSPSPEEFCYFGSW